MADTDTPTVDASAPGERYSENNPSFVPDPTSALGTLDTSGTGGGAHQDIREITKVFDVADVESAKVAAKALDPDDPTPESLVVLPAGSPMTVVDEESVRQRIIDKAASAEPVQLLGPTKAQEEAALSGDEDPDPDPTAAEAAAEDPDLLGNVEPDPGTPEDLSDGTTSEDPSDDTKPGDGTPGSNPGDFDGGDPIPESSGDASPTPGAGTYVGEAQTGAGGAGPLYGYGGGAAGSSGTTTP